ncbi:hypothetical protein, partial [Streptococcus agalactiae]
DLVLCNTELNPSLKINCPTFGGQYISDGFFYFRKLDLKATVRLIMPYAGIQTEETSFAILKLYYKSGGNLK